MTKIETPNTMESASAPPLSMIERESNALGGLFQNIITDLRAGSNNWDDLLLKANKFHMQLKSTISSSTAFLDAFQKIADMATTTRGGTKEIGSALTRLCLRNRSVEAKLKSLTSSLFDSFILPLQERVDEWKKIIVQIDKEHSKEIKRLKQFRKKHSSETRAAVSHTLANNTFRMKKNARQNKTKIDFPRIGSMYDVDKIMEPWDCKEKYFMLEEVERNYVRRALIEERSHYCLFYNLLKPVIEEEISMLQEMVHLEEILTTLSSLTNDPHKLPTSSENFLTNLQLNDTIALPDSSYSTIKSHSRKSSISSVDSFNTLSNDSVSYKNCKSLSQPNITPGFRPKSIASQDSGFLSHDYNVPNIGRLVIYNNNRNNKNPLVHKNGGSCVLNAENILNHDKNEMDCKPIEYATSESLFNLADGKNGVVCQPPPPIYVNIAESYQCTNVSARVGHFVSEGSITPTNQNADVGNIESIDSGQYHYTKPKACPPKPPVRYSSRLSAQFSEPVVYDTAKAKRSTMIYIQNKQDSSTDFPPPPPEAYLLNNRAQVNQKKVVNENSCCRYSVPNSHLVFCENQECLKNIQSNQVTADESNNVQLVASQQYLPAAYSFESNMDRSNVNAPTSWQIPAKSASTANNS